jgi:DNA modification methylase
MTDSTANSSLNIDWYSSQLEIGDFLAPSECSPSEVDLKNLYDLNDSEEILRKIQNIDWGFSTSKTRYLSHDIHPYPAKFIPQIPNNLIRLLSLRGELVFDPFGGCGTTALEAILLGRCALSTDLNPIAKVIGEAKTLTLIKEQDDLLCDLIEQLSFLILRPDKLAIEIETRRSNFSKFVPTIPNINEWFHQNAIDELGYLRWRIEELDCSKAITLANAAFSKSILKASFQDGETRYTRVPREVISGSIIKIFTENLSTTLSKVRQQGHLLCFREGTFKTVDIRFAITEKGSDAPDALIKDSVDLIVTSPPYPNTTDYHLYHRFRLFWLGFDPRDLAHKEIGSHLRHQKESTGFDSYLEEMTHSLAKMKDVLRPGRYAVLVVGDGVFKGQTYDTAIHLAQVAKELGFEVVGLIQRNLPANKRSFISAARRLKTETLLVIRKPVKNVNLTLLAPPYKLWHYEEILSTREINTLIGKTPKNKKICLEIEINPLLIDKVRKLTFTHGFFSSEVSKESTWQAILENGDAFNTKTHKKEPKYATHGIHSYKGKFYPQLAKSLFNLAQLDAGQKILDPFCGSGTVLLEAYLNGFKSFGTDINKLAVKIARVKTEILDVDPYIRDRILSRFQEKLESMDVSDKWIQVFSEAIREDLLSWFPRPVLAKFGCLLHNIQQITEPCVREFLEVIVSSLVRDVSQQDPKDLRIRRRKESIKDAPVYELFKKRLIELRNRLQHFSERAKSAPHEFLKATAIEGDSRNIKVFENNYILPESIDAVVTSPPYATALPYIDTDRLSLLLLFGLDSKKRAILENQLVGTREINKSKKNELDALIDLNNFDKLPSKTAQCTIKEIRKRNINSDAGFRRQNTAALLYMYFRDMFSVMTNVNTVLKKDASAFFVIGNNKTTAGEKEIIIDSGKVLQEIGVSLGWEINEVMPITVTTENRRHSKNSITENEIIWFKKRL